MRVQEPCPRHSPIPAVVAPDRWPEGPLRPSSCAPEVPCLRHRPRHRDSPSPKPSGMPSMAVNPPSFAPKLNIFSIPKARGRLPATRAFLCMSPAADTAITNCRAYFGFSFPFQCMPLSVQGYRESSYRGLMSTSHSRGPSNKRAHALPPFAPA